MSTGDCQNSPFVLKTTYANNTRANKWVIGVLFGILTLFFALVVYAADQAHDANGHYIKMTNSVADHKAETYTSIQKITSTSATYRAEKRASDKAMLEKLDEIKVELAERRKEERVLLEKILSLQLEMARRAASSD